MTPNESIGAAVRIARGAVSQDAVAEQMRQRGHKKWSQSTVWSVEQGTRPVRVVEIVDLAAILGADVRAFLPSPTPGPEPACEHFVIGVASTKTPELMVSACGKSWTPDANTIAVGRCPACYEIVETRWAK